jgi:hypothetical protein
MRDRIFFSSLKLRSSIDKESGKAWKDVGKKRNYYSLYLGEKDISKYMFESGIE